MPTHLDVIGEFREPPCPYCAGRRGIEYEVERGEPVRTAVTGVVSFAGMVGGVRYVVVRTREGALVTHGYLLDIGVSAGDLVERGDQVGHGTERLFIGVRIGGSYVDPRGGWCRSGDRRPRAVLVG